MDQAKLIANEFPIREGVRYLNHAAVSPWPRRTVEAVTAFAQENLIQGALEYARWNETEAKLRDQLKRLINAPSMDDIALLKNTSEGLSFVANGVVWKPGDTIVSSNEEFPSNRIVWEALEDRNVRLKQVPLFSDTAKSPEDALIAACDEHTRMLAISSVQYASGLRLNLVKLGKFCIENRILFCVDAIQSLGAIELDAQTCQADFVVADAHKWMLGPEGIALFYVKASLREQLTPSEFGWHMVEHHLDYDRQDWTAASTARRFECGSPNMLGIHACQASLSLILELGVDYIQRRVLDNTSYLTEYIQASEQLELRSPAEAGYQSGIVSFNHRRKAPDECIQTLRRNEVVCAFRGGAIRFSPHFYTPRERIDDALRIAEGL